MATARRKFPVPLPNRPDIPASAGGTPSPAKREAILEAATALFLEVGYASASMDAIAERAEVSKRTVYKHFGSKEALFATIIRSRCNELLHGLLTPETKFGGVKLALASLARQFLRVILAPSSLALHRVVISEAPRLPQLGAISYRLGPAYAVETLAAYLEEQTRAGVLAVADPRLAAEQYFGMLLGHKQLRALLGVGPAPSEPDLEHAVETAVGAFLAAYQRVPNPGGGPREG